MAFKCQHLLTFIKLANTFIACKFRNLKLQPETPNLQFVSLTNTDIQLHNISEKF